MLNFAAVAALLAAFQPVFGFIEGSVNADYLWQSNIIKGPFQLDWHIGVGGRVYFFGDDARYEHNFDMAARMPLTIWMVLLLPACLRIGT